MSTKDGGPAFPVGGTVNYGMSLRDYFAAAALSGLIPNAAWDYSSGPCNAAAAERCYAIADAMLAAREKQS